MKYALAPGVDVGQQEDQDEEDDLDQQEAAPRFCDRVGEDRGPGIEEDDFDVEDQEDHGHDVESHVEALARVADRHHAALVGLFLAFAGASRADDDRRRDVGDGEADRDHDQQQHRRPGGLGFGFERGEQGDDVHVFASRLTVAILYARGGDLQRCSGMLDKIKTYLRRHVRGFQRARQYPVLLPGHALTDEGVETVDGAARPLAPELRRALSLCDGTRTLAAVAREAGIARADMIRAHDEALLLMWRAPVPVAEPPAAMGHAPHSIILSPHLDDAALSCGGRMLGDQSVLVVNVFNTGAWWRFPHGPEDAQRIQACRQREEAMGSRLSGTTMKMLDLPEAMLRGYALSEVFTAAPDARDAQVA